MKKSLLALCALFMIFQTASVEAKETYAPLVKKTVPAVVNIFTKKVVRERAVSPLFNDPLFNQFFNSPMMQGRVRERVESSLGSGVIVEGSGTVVTSNHVIAGATEIKIVTSDGQEFDVRKIVEDPKTDLAVLKIQSEKKDFPKIDLIDSDEVEVGDVVLAIGNPFGVGQTVTSGIVSGVARTDVTMADYSFFIQTDAAINPGNSGGALIDSDGNLIGINTAIYSKDGGSLGIGFAIPSNMVKAILKAAEHGGKVVRPWMGLTSQQISADMVESLGLTRLQGALIKKVYPEGPAAKAGLQVGDVILSINGKEVMDAEAFKFRLATIEVGQNFDMEVIRKGVKFAVTMKAQLPPEKPAKDETLIEDASLLSGAVIANISPALMDEMGDVEKESGIIITEIKGGAVAALGLRRGDIILSLNGQNFTSVKSLVNYLKNNNFRKWVATIQRGNKTINLSVSR